MKESVTVVAQMRAKPGQEDAVRRHLSSLVAPSRTHAGCINYDLHESAQAAGTFMFHENWCSREELEQHLDRSEVKLLLEKVVPLLAEAPQITLWKKIG